MRLSSLFIVLACASCDDADESTALAVQCQLVPEGYGPAGTTAVEAELVADGLSVPWSVAWLPGGDMLVSERLGQIIRIRPDGQVLTLATIALGASAAEGGLLGLAVHPEVATNGWFYVYYTTLSQGAVVNQVERWVLAEDGLSASADRVIVAAIPALQFHNGGRLRFGPDGFLYVGTGDAGNPAGAQSLDYLGGKILRVADDGAVPSSNPFAGSPVWILGVRNTQGFDWRADGRLVVTDHGPSGLPNEGGRSGHDELALAMPGDNLGWPDSYACEAAPVVPSMTWAAAMPPGGVAIYTGSAIPQWRGDVFIGVLGIGGAIGHLHRVRLADDGNVTLSETYFFGALGRIRDVAMGPDGALYFTTSNCDGRAECGAGDAIYRVVPAR